MKRILCYVFLCSFFSTFSQSGNTIATAIDVDGSDVALNLLDYNSATASGLLPVCGSNEDVFYKHDVSAGDNKIVFGMTSLGLTLLTSVDYQILVAPNGNVGSLQEITCSSYNVVALVGGSFELVIENINPNDDYYLRVYKTSGLGSLLTDLLNGTTVTILSSYDSTLSVTNPEEQEVGVKFFNDKIELNTDLFEQYAVYDLSGKIIAEENINQQTEINLSFMKNGIYLINLRGDNKNITHKFVKY